MADTAPPAGGRFMKTLRFLNVLDDARNILSPVKLNVWSANLAGITTVGATILAWVTSHWGALEHVLRVGDIVGPYVAGSHVVHHFDKRERNKQAARLTEIEKGK